MDGTKRSSKNQRLVHKLIEEKKQLCDMAHATLAYRSLSPIYVALFK
jgi:hypothetical protein